MPQPHRQPGQEGFRLRGGDSRSQQGPPARESHARTSVVSTALLDHGNRCDSWNLFLDKLSFAYWENGVEDKKRSLKTEALQAVLKHYENGRLHFDAAIESRKRLLAALQNQHGNRFAVLTIVNSSRLLLHLGRANVLENVGLYCDRTTGLPLIPGSAVKGAVSTWGCWEANQNSDGTFPDAGQWTTARKGLHRRSFGDNSQSPGMDMAGGIMFLGGFPLTSPKLELDILTPHPDEGRGRITPNVFLSVAQGATWSFAFLALRQESQDDLAGILRLAEECLSLGGLGAKTASGYGQFRLLTDQEKAKSDKERQDAQAARMAVEKEAAEKERLQAFSPEDRAYFEYVAAQKDWTSAAREIDSRSENEKLWILKYFQSEPGAALLKTWTNEKGLRRTEALKKAGL